MSDDTDTSEEEHSPPDEGDETDTGEERPALDDDERATFDPDAVADVAGEIEAEVSGEEAPDDQDDTEEDGSGDEGATSGTERSSVQLEDVSLSWGDLYVESVATLLVVVADVYDDHSDITTDEIVELAQSGLVDVSAQVDRLVADMAGGPATELPPEYAVLLGTVLLAVAVLVKETDVAEDVLSDLATGGALAGGAA